MYMPQPSCSASMRVACCMAYIYIHASIYGSCMGECERETCIYFIIISYYMKMAHFDEIGPGRCMSGMHAPVYMYTYDVPMISPSQLILFWWLLLYPESLLLHPSLLLDICLQLSLLHKWVSGLCCKPLHRYQCRIWGLIMHSLHCVTECILHSITQCITRSCK